MIRSIIMALIAAVVGGYVLSQSARLEKQQKTIAEQGETIGTLNASNAAKSGVIMELRASKKSDDTLVAGTADKIDKLATRIRILDRRTREALANAPDLTLDSLLPAAAADALCLQWHEASGLIPGDHPGNASGDSDARTADPAAPDCGRWRRMTVRDAVEWNGQLLRHAGLEREDKAALREWAGEAGK